MENYYRMRSGIILILFFGILKSGTASGEWTTYGSRAAGMGSSSAAVVDLWSVNNNQAAMAFYDKTAAGFYYENRFLIKEMGSPTGAFIMKTKFGIIGTSLCYTGDASYNSTKAGLAYALKLGKRFSAGIQLDYIATRLGEDYGKRNNVTFDVGILVKITEQLTFGAHTFNPIQVQLSEYNNESIPASLNAGFAFTISDNLLVTAEAYKNSEFPMEFRSGIEYKFLGSAYARIGLCTNPARYTFGVGLQMKNLTFDFSSSMNAQLGYSPQVSLQYMF